MKKKNLISTVSQMQSSFNDVSSKVELLLLQDRYGRDCLEKILASKDDFYNYYHETIKSLRNNHPIINKYLSHDFVWSLQGYITQETWIIWRENWKSIVYYWEDSETDKSLDCLYWFYLQFKSAIWSLDYFTKSIKDKIEQMDLQNLAIQLRCICNAFLHNQDFRKGSSLKKPKIVFWKIPTCLMAMHADTVINLLYNIFVNAVFNWNANNIHVIFNKRSDFLDIIIADDWKWISIENTEKIFNEWFSTRKNGKWIWLANAPKRLDEFWSTVLTIGKNGFWWASFIVSLPIIN